MIRGARVSGGFRHSRGGRGVIAMSRHGWISTAGSDPISGVRVVELIDSAVNGEER